ncbi:hypothetical protein Mapa_000294 [Marchantia paleacea]|nr:hypothetical protein Mapa_000294 [Marchantia paleacea]
MPYLGDTTVSELYLISLLTIPNLLVRTQIRQAVTGILRSIRVPLLHYILIAVIMIGWLVCGLYQSPRIVPLSSAQHQEDPSIKTCHNYSTESTITCSILLEQTVLL